MPRQAPTHPLTTQHGLLPPLPAGAPMTHRPSLPGSTAFTWFATSCYRPDQPGSSRHQTSWVMRAHCTTPQDTCWSPCSPALRCLVALPIPLVAILRDRPFILQQRWEIRAMELVALFPNHVVCIPKRPPTNSAQCLHLPDISFHLPQDHQHQYYQVMLENQNTFTQHKDDIGQMHLIEHMVPIEGLPVHIPYCCHNHCA